MIIGPSIYPRSVQNHVVPITGRDEGVPLLVNRRQLPDISRFLLDNAVSATLEFLSKNRNPCFLLRHQVSTNRHRALRLQTFRVFVEATEDENVKDAVLLSATQAIFASTLTGLLIPGHYQTIIH